VAAAAVEVAAAIHMVAVYSHAAVATVRVAVLAWDFFWGSSGTPAAKTQLQRDIWVQLVTDRLVTQ
jgi:hypothetical protein